MYVKTLTIAQTAKILDVGQETVCTYLGNGKLSGSRNADEVSATSITAHRQGIIPHYAAMAQLLKGDDGLTDVQRGFDPSKGNLRFLPGLNNRERAIFKMRVKQFMQYKDIGAALVPPVTGQRVGAIIKTALKRLEIG